MSLLEKNTLCINNGEENFQPSFVQLGPGDLARELMLRPRVVIMSAEFLAAQEVKFWMHPEFSQVLCFSVPIVPGENDYLLSTYRVYLSPFSFNFSCHDVGYVDCLASSSAWEPRCWYLGDENLIRTGESSLSESIFIIPESHWHRRRIEAPFISNTVAPETKFNLEIVNQNLKLEANVENHKRELKKLVKRLKHIG